MAEEYRNFFESAVTADCVSGAMSDRIQIDSSMSIAIQNINPIATGTATVKVSTDGNKWDDYRPKTTNYDINSPIKIAAGYFPFKFIAFETNSGGTDTAVFNVIQRIIG